MYRLILVDDEAEIREGLKEVIPFEELGFTVVGEASNGVEALQLCEQTEPDLLLTDIRMPLMDGLTLCRKVHALLPTTQYIILSGYDDFEYARQAIEVQAMGYLLKPLSAGDFIEMLRKARASLDEEFSKRGDVTRLREHFRESRPVLREALLDSLLSSAQDAEQALESARKYELDLRAPFYRLALARVGENLSPGGIEDPELRLFAVRNIVSEVLQGAAEGVGAWEVFTYGGMVAVLFLLPDALETRAAQLVERLDEARKTARHYLDCTLYIGVSDSCAQLARLPACAKQAQTALNQCFLSGEEQVLCITDIQRPASDELTADDVLLGMLGNSLRVRDAGQAREALHALMDAARQNPLSPRAWQTYLLEVLLCFLRVASKQAQARDGLDDQLDALLRDALNACPGVDEVEARLQRLLDTLLAAMESSRQTSGRLLADEAERYLQENYAREDTSLEQLCLHLHISPSYFSMIFKKETKKTFHQYLTDLRMEKAFALLGTGEMKIAQVAESVGLPEPSYFSYCFKKYYGYSPSKTRGR